MSFWQSIIKFSYAFHFYSRTLPIHRLSRGAVSRTVRYFLFRNADKSRACHSRGQKILQEQPDIMEHPAANDTVKAKDKKAGQNGQTSRPFPFGRGTGLFGQLAKAFRR